MSGESSRSQIHEPSGDAADRIKASLGRMRIEEQRAKTQEEKIAGLESAVEALRNQVLSIEGALVDPGRVRTFIESEVSKPQEEEIAALKAENAQLKEGIKSAASGDWAGVAPFVDETITHGCLDTKRENKELFAQNRRLAAQVMNLASQLFTTQEILGGCLDDTRHLIGVLQDHNNRSIDRLESKICAKESQIAELDGPIAQTANDRKLPFGERIIQTRQERNLKGAMEEARYNIGVTNWHSETKSDGESASKITLMPSKDDESASQGFDKTQGIEEIAKEEERSDSLALPETTRRDSFGGEATLGNDSNVLQDNEAEVLSIEKPAKAKQRKKEKKKAKKYIHSSWV